MRILVCGGRDYGNVMQLTNTLNEYLPHLDHLIVGGAPGADTMAEMWARTHAIPFTVYMADWLFHGRAAGPLRNRRMLVDGKPDLVLAFSGGRGTANMVGIARAANVDVREVPA